MPQKSRNASLAEALRVTTAEAAQMVAECPALANYNHAQLGDKLCQMSGMLRLHPQQLGQALLAKPKVLTWSMAELESRLRELQKLFGPIDTVRQVCLCLRIPV